MALAHDPLEARRRPPPAWGSKRVTISSSPPRTQVVTSICVERRRPRARPRAASSRSPTRAARRGAACAARRRSRRGSRARTPRSASPSPTSAAARAAGPGSTTTVGPSRPSAGGTTSAGAVPTGSITRRARGDHRLLAVGRADRLLGEVRPAARAATARSPRCAPRAPRRAPSRGRRTRRRRSP